MPEESFNTQNQINDIELRPGGFVKHSLLRRMVARDVELMDRMAKGGPPSVVLAGSAIERRGDLVYTTNTTLGGTIYCDSITVNPGVTLTVDKFLVIVASGDITVHGHINADGCGRNDVLLEGVTAGGGGGGGDWDPGQNGSAGISGGGGLGGMGQDAPGSSGQALSSADRAYVLLNLPQFLRIGGGTGGLGSSNIGNPGGRGGGVIDIYCRALVVSSNGLISARGTNGANTTSNRHGGGGGGGGGVVRLRCVSCNGAERIYANGGSGGLPLVIGATRGGDGANGVLQFEVFN